MKDYLVRLWKDTDGDHTSVRTRDPHEVAYFRNFLILSQFLEVMDVESFRRSVRWLEPSHTYSTDTLQARPRSYTHYQYQETIASKSHRPSPSEHVPPSKQRDPIQQDVNCSNMNYTDVPNVNINSETNCVDPKHTHQDYDQD
ncbi:MAG: hypothetical protein AAF267_06465 [Deinococcota bacterium]